MQIIAELHIAQEVGNVENRKGVNEKYYFSINEINNTVSLHTYIHTYILYLNSSLSRALPLFFVCMKYDAFFSFFCMRKINFSVKVQFLGFTFCIREARWPHG